jgi:hypothetical protein
MVMALDLEGNGVAVPHVHEPRVLGARLHQKPSAAAGEGLQLRDRILIAAVLAPHHRIDAEFGVVRGSAEHLVDPGVFRLGKTKGAGVLHGADAGILSVRHELRAVR